MSTGWLLVSCFVSGLMFLYLGYYLNKVVKHRYGVQEKCCYCLDPKRGAKVLPMEIDCGEIDDMAGVGVVMVLS